MGDLSDFERGHIVDARLAGASVTKPAIILGVSRATVSKVMSAYNISEEEQRAKINIGRKRSSYIEKDCLEKSQLLQHK
jgi:transposase